MKRVDQVINGCNVMSYVPDVATKTQMIFLPGKGEIGKDINDLFKYSPLGFIWGGVLDLPYIVTGIQTPLDFVLRPSGDLDQIISVLDDQYPGITTRIITGISKGAIETTQYLRISMVPFLEKHRVKMLIPMSPYAYVPGGTKPHGYYDTYNYSGYDHNGTTLPGFNDTGIPMIAFCGADDGTATTFTNTLKRNVKTPDSVFILRPGVAHAGWSDQYNPARIWAELGDRNLYDYIESVLGIADQVPAIIELSVKSGQKLIITVE